MIRTILATGRFFRRTVEFLDDPLLLTVKWPVLSGFVIYLIPWHLPLKGEGEFPLQQKRVR